MNSKKFNSLLKKIPISKFVSNNHSMDIQMKDASSQVVTKLTRGFNDRTNTTETAKLSTRSSKMNFNLAEASPDFIAKNLKCSPKKSGPLIADPLTPGKSSASKIDIIGSKKSKKNLKRL